MECKGCLAEVVAEEIAGTINELSLEEKLQILQRGGCKPLVEAVEVVLLCDIQLLHGLVTLATIDVALPGESVLSIEVLERHFIVIPLAVSQLDHRVEDLGEIFL